MWLLIRLMIFPSPVIIIHYSDKDSVRFSSASLDTSSLHKGQNSPEARHPNLLFSHRTIILSPLARSRLNINAWSPQRHHHSFQHIFHELGSRKKNLADRKKGQGFKISNYVIYFLVLEGDIDINLNPKILLAALIKKKRNIPSFSTSQSFKLFQDQDQKIKLC